MKKKRIYSYGELLDLARQKDRIRELDRQLCELIPKLAVLLGEHIVFDCFRPIRQRLAHLYLSKSREYNQAFENYFDYEKKRICP